MLIQKLTDWAETNSARIVYFGKFSYSPLRKISFSFSFKNADLKSEAFQSLAKSLCPDDEREEYREMRRRQKEKFKEFFAEEGEESLADLFEFDDDESEAEDDSKDSEEYCDEDEDDAIELSYNGEERRLFIQGNFFANGD